MTDDKIDAGALRGVAEKITGLKIESVSYVSKRLQGGTLGDVRLVEGEAAAFGGRTVPFKTIYKTQDKWERPGDPGSWSREYDVYRSGLNKIFNGPLRMPALYRAERGETKIGLWLEHARGVSGKNLTAGMLARAARELGRVQGKIIKNPEPTRGMSFFSDTGVLKRDYAQWHKGTHTYEERCSEDYRVPEHIKKIIRENPWENGKTLEYNLLRLKECGLPARVKRMITDIDENIEAAFEEISRLPVVLCHRDFWAENIFYDENEIILIDWDCAGFGYLGEDAASLIADDAEPEDFAERREKIIGAYFGGISDFIEIPPNAGRLIDKIMVIKFGYRLVQGFMFAESDDEREYCFNLLGMLARYSVSQ